MEPVKIGQRYTQILKILSFGYIYKLGTFQNSCLTSERNSQSVSKEKSQPHQFQLIRKYQNPGGRAHQA
jgi:hypothetical protein